MIDIDTCIEKFDNVLYCNSYKKCKNGKTCKYRYDETVKRLAKEQKIIAVYVDAPKCFINKKK